MNPCLTLIPLGLPVPTTANYTQNIFCPADSSKTQLWSRCQTLKLIKNWKIMCNAKVQWFSQSLSKCALKGCKKPEVSRVLPPPQWFKATLKHWGRESTLETSCFSCPFKSHFDKLCKKLSPHLLLGPHRLIFLL